MKKLNPLIRFIKQLFERKHDAPELSSTPEPSPKHDEPIDTPILGIRDDISASISNEIPFVTDTGSDVSESEELSFRPIIESFFVESQKATRPSVILGVDLGTSFSKVVRRLGSDDVKPVCFGKDVHRLTDYLVPSVVAFESGNIVTGFNAIASDGNAISNFKMCLACESQKSGGCGIARCSLTSWHLELFPEPAKGEETKFISALFLADLITQTKQSVLKELRTTISETVVPKWTANFAVPDSFIEQSDIANAFQEVFRTAWLMSGIFLNATVKRTTETLFDCYSAAHAFALESMQNLSDEEFGCSPYPEIGAEIASIVMSKTSEMGLYAFVDVGGGTIDASIFRYFRDGEDAKRPPYAADVSNEIGAAQLEIRASSESGYPGGGYSIPHLKSVKETYDSFGSSKQEELSAEFGFLEKAAAEVQAEATNHLRKVLKNAFIKESRLDRWQDLRLIIGGGGAHLRCYRHAAVDGFSLYQDGDKKAPDTTQTLPLPDDFDLRGLPTQDYLRFAVAYGLSYPIGDLPDPDFCKDVEPVAQIPRKVTNYGDYYEK